MICCLSSWFYSRNTWRIWMKFSTVVVPLGTSSKPDFGMSFGRMTKVVRWTYCGPAICRPKREVSMPEITLVQNWHQWNATTSFLPHLIIETACHEERIRNRRGSFRLHWVLWFYSVNGLKSTTLIQTLLRHKLRNIIYFSMNHKRHIMM